MGLLSRLFGALFTRTTSEDDAGGPARIWRMDEDHPNGAWVDPRAPRSSSKPLVMDPDAQHTAPGWLTSSRDLLGGAEVVEYHDTVPAEDGEHTGRTG